MLGKSENKDNCQPIWKRKNTPDAAHATASGQKYHCNYCGKDGNSED
jgi:hypothetical protein